MVTRSEWVRGFLTHRGDPTSDDNLVAVLAWIRGEFGDAAPIPAEWNPMATTRAAAGATEFNHAGVKNYPTYAAGVVALSDTLNLDEPGYAAIRGTLLNGHDTEAVVDAIRNSAWGSKPTAEIVAYVHTHLAADSALEVGIAGPVEMPTPGDTPPAFPGTLLHDFTEGHGTVTWQQRMRDRGWSIAVDNKYGPKSAAVAHAFQAEKGLQVDGIVGPQTWAAAWSAPIT